MFGAGALRGLGGPLAGSGPLGVRERGPGKTGGSSLGGYTLYSILAWLSNLSKSRWGYPEKGRGFLARDPYDDKNQSGTVEVLKGVVYMAAPCFTNCVGSVPIYQSNG